jgi:UDP-3-O-[3-hydroxymyristoyl] glucosamine N-acyltransferase
MQLGELAEAVGLVLDGDPDVEIDGLAGLADAQSGDLTFVTGPRYRGAFEQSRASAFLAPPDFDAGDRPCLRTLQPYADFARVVELLFPQPTPAPGIHPSAAVAEDAELGADVSVGAYAVIGERVRVGAGTRIRPHVTIYPDCEIGRGCEIHSGAHLHSNVKIGHQVVIHSGAVIGSQGFGFAFRGDGTRIRIPHRAGVVIEDEVEIGANTTIDASHFGHSRDALNRSSTRIGRGVKIDNQVQVAHGCEVDDGSTLCAGVGIAGSTRIGKNVFFGGLSATSGNLKVGDGTAVLGMSGVMGDTEPGSKLVGVPVLPRGLFFRIQVAMKKLPDLLKRIRRIEETLGLEPRK